MIDFAVVGVVAFTHLQEQRNVAVVVKVTEPL